MRVNGWDFFAGHRVVYYPLNAVWASKRSQPSRPIVLFMNRRLSWHCPSANEHRHASIIHQEPEFSVYVFVRMVKTMIRVRCDDGGRRGWLLSLSQTVGLSLAIDHNTPIFSSSLRVHKMPKSKNPNQLFRGGVLGF